MSKCLLKCLTFFLFPLLARIAELWNVPCQNCRNYAWKLQSLPECLEIKISFSCHVDFIVNQICYLKDVAWLECGQLIFLIFYTLVCKFGQVEGVAQEKKLQTNE